jgi:ribosomal protein S18 acetylase RimI-like enzyme
MVGFYRDPHLKAKHKGIIWGVYVSESWRGRGIGRALLSALLEKVKAYPGLEQVTLVVASGQVAARNLYFSLGFETFGRERAAMKVGEQPVDHDHMVLRLR